MKKDGTTLDAILKEDCMGSLVISTQVKDTVLLWTLVRHLWGVVVSIAVHGIGYDV